MADGERSAETRRALGSVEALARYRAVRSHSLALAAPLSGEDAQAQSMPDASPAKWHLAHTTWFFERLILQVQSDETDRLFNSYYEALGDRVARPERGLMTRPTLAEVLAYRHRVDEAMQARLSEGPDWSADQAYLFELGLNHEQQHQELLLSDILHLFSRSPLEPAFDPDHGGAEALNAPPTVHEMEGGLIEIGAGDEGFAFDNEGPRHRVWLEPYAISDRLVTNGEFADFIADGGYRNPQLWLADGWARVQAEGWTAPLYWRGDDVFGLGGRRPRDPAAPVSHLSFYEAEAYARWIGARLPTEAEWEHAAARGALRQVTDTLWQWTASAYGPYPGFRETPGTAAEYNGKFMANQMVLRGGAFATPAGHARISYRNFYYPHQRWMFSGLRLAWDRQPMRSVRPPQNPEFARALVEGLSRRPRSLSPKWFYDAAGSELFEDITRLAEYYPTRQELSLLKRVAPELADTIAPGAVLVEPGSGASAKTRLLLDAAPQIGAYVPVDISPTAVAEAAAALDGTYRDLTVAPVVADFTREWAVPDAVGSAPRLGFFPGSTIGNFEPDEAVAILVRFREILGAGARLILGVDWIKDEFTLVRAYDDAKGVTGRFNSNVLVRANREAQANFNVEAFEHRAVWNATLARVEMHLVARSRQTVSIGEASFVFEAGDGIHTENSHKFDEARLSELAERSGWRPLKLWLSDAPVVALALWEAEA